MVLEHFFGLSQVSHETIQLHLKLVGASMYEYHSNTGRWPAHVEDLAETSLPLRSPYWKTMIDSGTIVLVWHDNLNPDPTQNAGVILAYHNRGLLAQMGRHWVCWGDLRTEYITSSRLQDNLQRVEGPTTSPP